ncbi:CD59 glycoprotein-like [Sebastes fasciatus]|uniref:CD59 glycoprotein-like n=1 Tax=Sebastes fasciatus TaxID=394691 RepID=UPI003D9E6946
MESGPCQDPSNKRWPSDCRCYNCSDYTGRCQNVQKCTYEEDSCLSLTERDGKIIRQCFRFTDCDRSVLSQIFTDIYSHSSCCSGDLCNSDDYDDFRDVSNTAPPFLALILTVAGSLLSVWWFWD